MAAFIIGALFGASCVYVAYNRELVAKLYEKVKGSEPEA
jgi:hypothetical protein